MRNVRTKGLLGISFVSATMLLGGAQDAWAANKCTRAAPTVSVMPLQSTSVPAGTKVSYQVWVKNNDSFFCKSSSFALKLVLPTGIVGGLSTNPLSVSAGGNQQVSTLSLTSSASQLPGLYTIPVSATNANSGMSGSAVASYTVMGTVSASPSPTASPKPSPVPSPTPSPVPSPVPSTASGSTALVSLWAENATQTEYDSVNHLKWVNALGDFRDANGVAQGTAAFASVAVADTDVARFIEMDVTSYVKTFGADFRINREGGTNIVFNSREATDNRPELVITRSTGNTVLAPSADVSMDSSTVYSVGTASGLATQYGFLIRFNQGPDAGIQKALLRLYATAPQYGNQTLKVFRPDPGLKGGTQPAPSPSPVSNPSPTPTVAPSPAPVVGVDFNSPVVRTWTETGKNIYYNGALELAWETNPKSGVIGDWRDANNLPQGSTPFSYKDVIDMDARQVIQIDVTSLVKMHGADIRINRSGGTNFIFNSREATNLEDRPVLILDRSGVKTQLQAEADTSFDPWDNVPGAWNTLSTQYGFMIRFPQAADATITSATLQLVTTATQYGNQRLLVFRPDPHPVVQNPPALSLGTSADIVFHLEGSALYDSMSSSDRTSRARLSSQGLIEGSIAAGTLPPSEQGVVMNSMWSIPVAARSTEMFSRTIMKLNSDFDPNWSGKMPGLANTGMVDRRAVQCGWGGRTVDGTCWSARTWFLSTPNAQQFGKEYLSFGGYAYRLNHTSDNGEGPRFNYPIHRDEFFVLDQRVKLNSINGDGTPAADGELTYWLNGVPVMHWTGIVWRNNASADTLPSELWGDMYIGGVGYVAPHPHSYTLHSLTVSKKLLPFDGSLLKTLNGN